jgi:hypothetical protein
MLLASAPLDPNHQHVDPTNNASDPLWKLLFIFEALILFPPPKQQKLANCSRIVQAHIGQFRRGDIIALCEEAFDLDKHTAPSITPPSFDNATTLSHSAQVAADADNYGVASQRMQSCMPTVTITDETSEEIKNLHPERINFPSPTSEPTHPEHTQHTTRTTKNKSNNNNPEHNNTPSTATQQFAHHATSKRELHPGHSHTAQTSSKHMHLHYASWEDSRYSKGERTMKVKVKSCC